MKRYFITENRECGEPILEIRDREQEKNWTLIAEFYPHGWTNAHHEVASLVARLNGEPAPSRKDFYTRRLADLETRVRKLEATVDKILT